MTLVSVWKCVCDGVEGARAADRGHVIELVMIEFIDTHSPNHLAFKGPLSNGHGLQEGSGLNVKGRHKPPDAHTYLRPCTRTL